MSQQIEKNLAHAFAGESRASVRNATYALKAERDGYSNVARLFRAVADADAVHARRFLYLMRGKISNTSKNLETALQAEIRALEEEYPEMVEVAKRGSKAVKKAFAQSMKTDDEHAALYRNAEKDMLNGESVAYFVCQICGHIHVDLRPENCPVCKAVSGKFKRID